MLCSVCSLQIAAEKFSCFLRLSLVTCFLSLSCLLSFLIHTYDIYCLLILQAQSSSTVHLSAWECAGYFVFKKALEFDNTSEDEISKILASVSLDDGAFLALKQLCGSISNKLVSWDKKTHYSSLISIQCPVVCVVIVYIQQHYNFEIYASSLCNEKFFLTVPPEHYKWLC